MIVFARIVSVLSVQYIFVLFGAKQSLKFKECVFLSYAGMIRGAIALGLAIKAHHFFSEYDFVVASVLALVILSTLLFGSFMPLVAKCLLDPPKKGGKHHSNSIEQEEPMLKQGPPITSMSFDNSRLTEGNESRPSISQPVVNQQHIASASSYSALMHPNADPSVLSQ